MQFKRSSIALCLVLGIACSAALSNADDLAVKGQEIFEKYRHAVVTVEVVLKSSYSRDGKVSPPTESQYDLTGTFVDPAGLVALAHSGCDPAEFYKRATSMYDGYKVESEVIDLKILLDDNTEVPAEIVLRDKDRDLAFVRPKVPLAHPITAVDLSKSGAAKVLDQVIVLNRLNQVSGRAYSASLARIIAVVEKPRLFYLHDGVNAGTGLGSPVFSLDGNLLGLMLMRVGGPKSEDGDGGTVSIIVPTQQVVKAAAQVASAQKPSTENQQPVAAKNPK